MVYTRGVKFLSKKSKLDQYYTSVDAVNLCYDVIRKYYAGERLLEPSAGAFAFWRSGYRYLAFDIEPKNKNVIRSDFLKTDPLEFKDCFAVGNPPFGFCGRLAVKFINHCAESCDKICFILPNTFKKELFFDKHLNKWLHLIEVVPLPKNSFILDGVEYDVPCSIFYIERLDFQRKELTFYNYLYETINDDGVFVRRVGGRAGQVVDKYTASTTYKLTSDWNDVSELLDKYKEAIKEVASYTAGVRSITVDELNWIISRGEQ